ARADVSGIAANLAREYPKSNAGWSAVVQPLRESIVGEIRPALLILAGAVGFVLLIACVNVANMLLVRSTARRQEIAIRSAMGASRTRLVSQLLTESTLLSVAGGALALLFAAAGTKALIAVNPGIIPRAQSIHMDLNVFGFTFLLSIVTGMAFGLFPAFAATRANLQDSLREGGRTGAGVARRRLRGALVAAEVALALMLLICAGLLIQSFSRLTAISPGFRTDHGLTVSISIPQSKYPKPEQQAAFFDQVLEKSRALPGIQSAAASGLVPMSGNGLLYSFRIEGSTALSDAQQHSASYFLVTPGYLQTMGIQLLSGRDFSRQDSPDTKRVCLINDVLARQFFSGSDPIGRQLHIGRKDAITREIIGVVSSVKPDQL
ncbi:MAG: FtsX-like permease family protein, partial [Candidatus Acidiferrales bacterium]